MRIRNSRTLYKGCGCAALCIAAWVLLAHPFTALHHAPQPTVFQNYLQQSLDTTYSGRRTKDAGLTIKDPMQQIVKQDLSAALRQTSSKWATGIIMNVHTGAIQAITSLSNPNPAICAPFEACHAAMQNSAVSAWEPGSIMKPLLMAAAFNSGSLSPNSTYYDPEYTYINGRLFTNAEYVKPGKTTMQQILSYSLNTGAIHVLKSMGGGEINLQARQNWYDYLTNHYQFGSTTGLPFYGESPGEVRTPSGGRDVEVQYAGSAFGVGITTTPIQMVAAYASLVNGGIYYQPHVLAAQKPVIVDDHVISKRVSDIMIKMLHQTLVFNEPAALRTGYVVGAKTGTAPIAGNDGAYKVGTDSGTYIGYIGASSPEDIMLVRLDEPQEPGFASASARVVWSQISNQLIDQHQIK